jgi:prevent-host-death family protein
MDEFRSLHLQKNLGDVLASAEVAPVVLVNRGQPRVVLMSAAEFRRLKQAAGEPVPSATMPRRPVVIRGRRDDPLGYDTTDFLRCARAMAEAALAGRNREAVEAELAKVRRRLGLPAPESGRVAHEGRP